MACFLQCECRYNCLQLRATESVTVPPAASGRVCSPSVPTRLQQAVLTQTLARSFGDGARRRKLTRVRLGDAALDALKRAVFGKLFDVANRVANRARVRASVPDDDDLLNAQERRSAVLRVVEPLLQILKRR